MNINKQSSEFSECVGFLNWFKTRYPGVLIFHIANGGKRDIKTASQLKQMGVVPGIPDYMIPEMRLFIEMKNASGKLSQAQKEIIPKLEACGYNVIIASGARDASEKVLEFCK